MPTLLGGLANLWATHADIQSHASVSYTHLDVYKRQVMGYYITLEAPGDLSLGMAMCHAILPKDETLKRLDYKASWPVSGFMWSVLSDNAGEFHGNMLELAAMEYGIELRCRKVKQPQYGAHIESYLGKLS